MNRKLTCVVFAAALILGGLTTANAGQIWDAYTQYNTSGVQTSTDVWQYFTTPAGSTAYTPMPSYLDSEYQGSFYNIWRIGVDDFTAYFAKITDGPYAQTDIRADHGDFALNTNTVLGWRSPIDGTVDLAFEVRKQVEGGDGANYYLYEAGNATPLASGYIAGYGDGTASGTITLPNLPVTVGKMFYLQMDPNGNPASDTLGCNMTVTEVPEPGTIVLLSSGILGLAVYFRRNRK